MKRYSLLRVFLASSLGDQVRMTLAGVLLVSISIGFAVGSFSRIRRYLLRLCDSASVIALGSPNPEKIVDAVDVVDRYVPGDRSCLIRSLTAESLLRLYEFTPEHRIGVAKETDEGMEAHSWLELRGDVLIGDLDDLSRFEPLPSLEMGDRM